MPQTGEVRITKRKINARQVLAGLLMVVLLAIAGCSQLSAPGFMVTPTFTPFRPVTNTPTPLPTSTPTLSPTPIPSPTPEVMGVFAGADVPESLKASVVLPAGWVWVDSPESALLRLQAATESSTAPIQWVYAVAAPFPIVLDGVTQAELRDTWRGQFQQVFRDLPLLMSANTRAVFQRLWGESSGYLETTPSGELVDAAWRNKTWVLLPFEQLEPRLKALRVDGSSVLVKGALQGYPFVMGYELAGDPLIAAQFSAQGGSFPATNRDPGKMSVVLMTGTTALVRAVGWRMEGLGLEYPARDIKDWLLEPDFTHISNEASFNPACPAANPSQESLMFCSRPEYIQLLDAIQPEIIELSGNHNNDWGRDANRYSLELYRERGWRWFAGGENSDDALTPLIVEHNGNRLAFLGCNMAGPPSAWATDSDPGAARCDLDDFSQRIETLRGQGYLPIMTFQYHEIYVSFPSERQEEDFMRMADAGAEIVSGSQAHFPQGFAFANQAFIHYGLGNLFFDQMDSPVDGTRREFLDRHVFYDGRHLSTELLTAMLEDYSRPRPMTDEERADFLADVFAAEGW